VQRERDADAVSEEIAPHDVTKMISSINVIAMHVGRGRESEGSSSQP
jgi:hypothetical protein